MEKPHSREFGVLPSIADLFFVIILLFLVFSRKGGLLADGDTGYHIRAGEYIIENLSIPYHDIFSFHTPALPWTAHEWLSEVIMALVHNMLGLPGVVAFFAVLIAFNIYLLFKVLRWQEADIYIATAVTLLVVSSAQIHWLARPHVFSLLFVVFYHHLLEEWHREKGNRLYLLPLIMLLWVNLHGGFPGGFILIGAYLCGSLFNWVKSAPGARSVYGKKAGQLSLTLLAALAACGVNPYGYQILLFPLELISDNYIMDHVSEFLSPDFHTVMPFKYLLLLLMAILALSRRSVEPTELILILVLTNMSLYSARHIPLFALILAPIISRHANEERWMVGTKLAAFFSRRSEYLSRIDARGPRHLWPLLALLVVGGALHLGQTKVGFSEKIHPIAATEFLLREKVPGNVYNNDEFGDYLIYRSYPEYRVFFDGRSDMYGAEVMKEYAKVSGFEPGWEAVLEKYRITWIFYQTNSNLSRYLLKDSNWVLIYSDEVASIFVRDIPWYATLIRKHRKLQLAES